MITGIQRNGRAVNYRDLCVAMSGFGHLTWHGEVVFAAGQGAVGDEPGDERVQAGLDVGAAPGPAVQAGDASGEFAVRDPACVADEICEGKHEFVVVDVFDLATAEGEGRRLWPGLPPGLLLRALLAAPGGSWPHPVRGLPGGGLRTG